MAANGTTDKLSARQHKALMALMSEPTIAKAAEKAEVPERTLYNWLREPDFDAAYRSARRMALQQAIAQAQQHSGALMRRLLYLALNARSEAVQLGAIAKAFEISIKAVELEDLAARLEALEHAYAQNIR